MRAKKLRVLLYFFILFSPAPVLMTICSSVKAMGKAAILLFLTNNFITIKSAE